MVFGFRRAFFAAIARTFATCRQKVQLGPLRVIEARLPRGVAESVAVIPFDRGDSSHDHPQWNETPLSVIFKRDYALHGLLPNAVKISGFPH
jgi:hypothetical protein